MIVDRRRIRRKLTFWRVVAAVVAYRRHRRRRRGRDAGGRSALTASGSIARVKIDGLIRSDQAACRGAGAAGEVAGRRRHRAHQFAGRHHRRFRAALRFAGAAEGEEAAGRGRRGAGRLRRLHRRDRGRSHRGAAELAGRLDRRTVPVPEFHRLDEDRRRQGRGSEVLAAEGRAQRLRADQPRGARGDRRAGEGSTPGSAAS